MRKNKCIVPIVISSLFLVPLFGFAQLFTNETSDLVLNGNCTLIINGTGFHNNGTIHNNTLANLYFDGSIQISGNALSLNNLTLNTASNITLQVPLTINTKITFTDGYLHTSVGNELIVSDNATAVSASSASHVVGPVIKNGDDDFTFPIGDGSNYAPIGISGLAGSETYQAEYKHGNPHSDGFDTASVAVGIDHVSSAEYWNLSRTGAEDAYVTLYWDETRSGPISAINDLLLCHWNTSPDPDQWESLAIGAPTGTTASGSITSAAKVSSFSPFTLGSSSSLNVLPVTLTKFMAYEESDIILIQWETLSEQNNSYFTLEKSNDGYNYIPMAQINGAGNSSTKNNYQFADKNPAVMNYYRLKQTDFDGHTSTFQTIYCPFEANDIIIYVAKELLQIKNLNTNTFHTILISNYLGQTVYSQKFYNSSTSAQIPFDVPSGIYVVSLFNENTKLAVQRIKK